MTAPVPPASVTNLHNTTYQPTSITWNWTNPGSANFTNVKVYLDGVFKADVPMGTQTYTASGLTPLTAYTLGTRTEGPAGAINATWVNNTSTTALAPPVPPASITNLHNTTYQPTTITWNWTDPSSPGYTNARVFLNDVFQADVAKGVQTFTKTGLTPSTAYTLKINTEGPIGYHQRDLGYQHCRRQHRFRPRVSRTSITPRTSRPVLPGTGRIPARPTSPMSRCISTGYLRPMCPWELRPTRQRASPP